MSASTSTVSPMALLPGNRPPATSGLTPSMIMRQRSSLRSMGGSPFLSGSGHRLHCRQVYFLAVFFEHAPRREHRRYRAYRFFHHVNPSPGRAAPVEVVIKGDYLFLEQGV